MSQFFSRDYGVIYGLENNFNTNRMRKLLMSPINSFYRRGDHLGSVLSLNLLPCHEVMKLEIFKELIASL